jgi:putative SOS response-associated peptidase YedK
MLVAVRSQDGKRIPQQMRWGLVPWWAKDIKVGFSSINARAETIDTAPAFRDAWKKGQRCLVVTDGFYEWKKPEKQPYAVAMADESLSQHRPRVRTNPGVSQGCCESSGW